MLYECTHIVKGSAKTYHKIEMTIAMQLTELS